MFNFDNGLNDIEMLIQNLKKKVQLCSNIHFVDSYGNWIYIFSAVLKMWKKKAENRNKLYISLVSLYFIIKTKYLLLMLWKLIYIDCSTVQSQICYLCES